MGHTLPFATVILSVELLQMAVVEVSRVFSVLIYY